MSTLRIISDAASPAEVERFSCIEIADPVLRAKLRLACTRAGVSPEAFIVDLLRDALGHIQPLRKEGTTS